MPRTNDERWLWVTRAVWALLPVLAGESIADALTHRSDAVRATASVWLWAAWAIVLVALLAPRPRGLTITRALAPAAPVAAVLASADAGTAVAALGVVATTVATALALAPPFALAAVNAPAYGDERRYPLRIPRPLLAGPLPLVVGLVLATLAGTPLFVAAERPGAGVAVAIAGLPVSAIALRSLHALARRWFVLVPAGCVIVDPLTLTDPLLVRREAVASLRASETAPPDAADLRLGARRGSLLLRGREPLALTRRGGRARAEVRQHPALVVAVVRPQQCLAAARERRIPVGTFDG
jgi:hypothetical protein